MQNNTAAITSEPPCPPCDAAPANGAAYYRCCQHPDGNPMDFLSAEEAGTFQDQPDCNRRALSLLANERDARHMMRVQRRSGWKHIMTATLQPEHGHIKPTPSANARSHSDWWPPNDLDSSRRAALFSLVEDEE